jgi:predicted metal-dependent hydrolase
MLSIRKVLYHEMAHNEHSEHDDKFYMLMREIERDVLAYNASGRALGGAAR